MRSNVQRTTTENKSFEFLIDSRTKHRNEPSEKKKK